MGAAAPEQALIAVVEGRQEFPGREKSRKVRVSAAHKEKTDLAAGDTRGNLLSGSIGAFGSHVYLRNELRSPKSQRTFRVADLGEASVGGRVATCWLPRISMFLAGRTEEVPPFSVSRATIQ